MQASEQPVKEEFSILRWPKSVLVRMILICLSLIALISFFIESIFGGVVASIVTIITLWIANRFEYQDQQLQYLQQQLQQIQQQLYQDKTSFDLKSISQKKISTTMQISESSIESSLQEKLPVVENKSDINPINTEINNTKSSENYQVMTSLLQAGIDWFKGGNSIVRIAIIILLIGVILLLRFAGEYWQLTLSAKMASIATGGLGLTGLGYYLRQKRFDYAISLQGAGLGILFLVLFSSYYLHALNSVLVAYLALILLLFTTLWLALKQNALFLAFIALTSGFIAPFLLNTGQQDIPSLMAYLFILNLALAVIALFKPWRILNTVALLLTFGIGGLAIWQYALDEQRFAIACWVWAIFILYLFMSVRYSQHIASLAQKIKNIPIVDTTLIFATPFMAFSLYAGLVDSDGYALSVASAILSMVYLIVGYFIHRKFNLLSVLSQCFYGLGFVFLALILPFAFDAYWSSVGWAIHGIAMLYLGWRYQLNGAKYFAALLLFISGIASIVAGIFDEKSLLFASSILMLVYALAYYLFRAVSTSEKEQGEQQLDHLLSNFFLVFSFFAASYVYSESLGRVNFYYEDFSLGLLIWFAILSILWWWRDRLWSNHWCISGYILLLLTASHSLIYQSFVLNYRKLMQLDTFARIEFLLIAILWSTIFVFIDQYSTLKQKTLLIKMTVQILSAIAIIFLACIGILYSSECSVFYFSATLPIVILGMTVFITPLHSWQKKWVENPLIIGLSACWLVWVSILSTGTWGLPYVLILNPIDLCSIFGFALLSYALRPYLLNQSRIVQLLSAGMLLILGLLLMSSLLLRMLYHYMGLPYWSLGTWSDSTIQMGLTILWASLALILTLLASKKAWRYIWMLGIAVLAIVVTKLIFLDLSHSHTLTRIISFIGSGVIMLVMGYFAPLPPKSKQELNQESQTNS